VGVEQGGGGSPERLSRALSGVIRRSVVSSAPDPSGAALAGLSDSPTPGLSGGALAGLSDSPTPGLSGGALAGLSDSPTPGLSGGAPLFGVGEQPSESGVSDFRARFRNEVDGTIDEYTADQLDSKIFDTLFDLWKTSDERGPVRADNIIGALDSNIHIIGLKDPSGVLLASISVPGASFWSSIVQEAPINIVDKPLGLIRRCVEVGGIIVGVATGHSVMAWACFKALLRNEVHRMSAKAVDHLMTSGHSRRTEGNEPLSENHIVHNAHTTANTAQENAKAAGAGRERAEQEQAERFLQERSERAELERAQHERVARFVREQAEGQRVEQERAARSVPEEAERQRAARAKQQTNAGALSKDHSMAANVLVKRKKHAGRSRGEVSEGREASNPTGLRSGHARSVGGISQNKSHESFDFVRLRIYYDCVNMAASTSNAPPGILVWLIVVRESGKVLLPDLPEITSGVSHAGVDAMSGDFAVTSQTCQLWSAPDEKGFALDALGVAVLQESLRTAFLGCPLGSAEGDLVARPIPLSSADQYIDHATGCIEVIGIIDRHTSTDTKVACLGFKAPAHDDFCRIAISAVNKPRRS
jgi:hypothetical protein